MEKKKKTNLSVYVHTSITNIFGLMFCELTNEKTALKRYRFQQWSLDQEDGYGN